MPVRYSLTEQDVVSGNDLWRRQQMNIWPLVAVLTFSWLMISAYLARTLTGIAFGLAIGLLAVVLLLLAAVTLWHGKRKSRRLAVSVFRMQKDSGRAMKMAWNADEIEFNQRKASRKQAWKEITGWAQDDTTLVLLGKGRTFNPIPVRALSADDLAQIKAHLALAGAKPAKLFFY